MARPVEKLDGIVRAALELFVEKGIDGTTIRDIAKRAGTAEGTMYRHYRSKDELAWTIFRDNLDRFMAELRSIADSEPSCRDSIRAMIRRFYDFFEDDPVLYSYLLLSEHALFRRFPVDFESPIEVLRHALARGKEQGELRDIDVELFAAMIFGAATRVSLFKVHGRIDDDLRTRSDEVAGAIWEMIGRTRPAPPKEVDHELPSM